IRPMGSSINNGFLLYGRSAAKLEQNLANGLGERPVDRASAGAFVASAAETLSHVRNIEFAFAAQAYAVSSFRHLAEKCCHLDTADGKDVIDQAFAIFFNGAAAFHLFAGHPRVSDMTFHAQIAQGFTEQPDLAN